MILISADSLRSMWYCVFSIISVRRGPVATDSALCQAGGFMLRFAGEVSDYMVLAMAIHAALQVFRSSTSTSSEGLYPYRLYVYFGAFAIPIIMASLVFINPEGYSFQAASCSLPIRPFWYRLALAWVPRYMIAIVILGLAIAIYAHVGIEFKMFSDTEASLGSLESGSGEERDVGRRHAWDTVTVTDNYDSNHVPASSRAQPPSSSGRHSAVTFDVTHPHRRPLTGPASPGPDGPRRFSENSALDCSILNSPLQVPQNDADTPLNDAQARPDPDPSAPSATLTSNSDPRRSSMARQRARIRKQLRLIFIYPLVYIVMWVIPFVQHCMNYKDRWARNPIFAISLLSLICLSSIGFVNVLVFTFREKPWRYMDVAKHDGGPKGVRRGARSFLGKVREWWDACQGSGGCFAEADVRTKSRAEEIACTEAAASAHRPDSGAGGRAGNGSYRPTGLDRHSTSEHRREMSERARARLQLEREDGKKLGADKKMHRGVLDRIDSDDMVDVDLSETRTTSNYSPEREMEQVSR